MATMPRHRGVVSSCSSSIMPESVSMCEYMCEYVGVSVWFEHEQVTHTINIEKTITHTHTYRSCHSHCL
jgi:hypothetical protein